MISLAGRDILHAWGKFVFTGIGLGLLIGVTLVMAGVYRGMVDDGKALLDNSGADLWVVQKDTLGPYAESSSLNDDVYRAILAMIGKKEGLISSVRESLASLARLVHFIAVDSDGAALAKVRAARALIAQEKWDSDAFTLGIVVDTAGVAAQEYRNALVAGRLDSLIEYHDTRGFIFYLSDLLSAHHGSDPRLAQAATTIAELRTYVEPLTPPNPPRASDVQFEEKVASLRALLDAPPPAQ